MNAYPKGLTDRRKQVLFLDARRSSIFEEGHIAGARSFSVWESDIDDKVNALFEERADPAEQNKPIVIYCSGGACEDSHMLAQKLWGIQFNNVYVYKDDNHLTKTYVETLIPMFEQRLLAATGWA